jgi:hypothetical protein
MTMTTEQMKILATWDRAKSILEAAKAEEMDARKAVVAEFFPADAKVGTNRIPLANGYALKYMRKINYKLASNVSEVASVDGQIRAMGNEGSFIAERILKRVYDFSATEYKKLEPENPTHKAIKQLVDSVLTTSDSAPSLEIEEPKK